MDEYHTKYYIEHREEIRVRCAKYHLEHKKEKRIRKLAEKYNISEMDYDKMFTIQNGQCAICGNPPKGIHLAIDHNHTTGKVRGLLCSRCNYALGLFSDSKNILAKAVEYLKKFDN